MAEVLGLYDDVTRMIGDLAPEVPVYCIYIHRQRWVAEGFLAYIFS